MRAALVAVASAPPKRFAGGGYWQAMKGAMTGWFELRVDGPGRHHYRLFCLLDYDAEGLEKPLLVVIDGRDKPFRTTLSDADYTRKCEALAWSTASGTRARSVCPREACTAPRSPWRLTYAATTRMGDWSAGGRDVGVNVAHRPTR